MEPSSRTFVMSRRARARLALVLLPLLAMVMLPTLALADWTQFQGDPTHSGSVTGAAQAPYKQSWSMQWASGGPKGQYGLSAPVVSGSTIIAVAPTAVIGVDPINGSIIWTVTRQYGPSTSPAVATAGPNQVVLYTEGFGAHPPGSSPTPSASISGSATSSPSSSPSPSAGGTQPGFASHLTAMDLATRRKLWSIQLQKVSRTGVTVEGQTAFVGDNAGTIYAIDISSGKTLWTQSVGGFVDKPLAAADGKVFVPVQGTSTKEASVVALSETDGKIAWSYQTKRANLLTAASVGDGKVVLGAAMLSGGALQTPSLKAIDAAKGTLSWSTPTNAPISPFGAPAIAAGAAIAFDTNGQIYSFDLATGSRRWDFVLNEPNRRASPLVNGSQVLVQTANGMVAVFDSSTGELVWRTAVGPGVLRDAVAAPGSIVMVRGGVNAGLIAFVNDPTGALVRVASPTTPDWGKLLGGALVTAVPLGLVLVLAGRWLAGRAGPAFPDDVVLADEPTDPWEQE